MSKKLIIVKRGCAERHVGILNLGVIVAILLGAILLNNQFMDADSVSYTPPFNSSRWKVIGKDDSVERESMVKDLMKRNLLIDLDRNHLFQLLGNPDGSNEPPLVTGIPWNENNATYYYRLGSNTKQLYVVLKNDKVKQVYSGSTGSF